MDIVEWMRLTIITNDKQFSCNISYYSYTVITIFPMNRGHLTHDRGSLTKSVFIFFQKRNYASQQINKSLNVTSVVTLIYWENTYLLINNNVLIIETYTKA